jgi:endonuclease III
VTRRLSSLYGSPRLNNKDDPLDELVFIILSQMTTGPSYERVFEKLRAAVNGWRDLDGITEDQLRALIADAGLSNQKAPRIAAIARRLRTDFGDVTLEPLAGMADIEAEAYLTSLPGVGTKTAKCVMMYSLGREVLPIDTHVGRVARRLGLLSAGSSGRQHGDLEGVVRPADRYDFHVNVLVHGRAICTALRPQCVRCVLTDLCPSAQVSSQPPQDQPAV